jgi:hypothetical protein
VSGYELYFDKVCEDYVTEGVHVVPYQISVASGVHKMPHQVNVQVGLFPMGRFRVRKIIATVGYGTYS